MSKLANCIRSEMSKQIYCYVDIISSFVIPQWLKEDKIGSRNTVKEELEIAKKGRLFRSELACHNQEKDLSAAFSLVITSESLAHRLRGTLQIVLLRVPVICQTST